jgi:hypothetical protein
MPTPTSTPCRTGRDPTLGATSKPKMKHVTSEATGAA